MHSSQEPSITADPENLMAINTLAGMGILTEDDSLVDAALSEIQSLSIERRQELDPRRDVTYLLVQHHLGQVGSSIHRISEVTDSRTTGGCRASHQNCTESIAR